MNADIHPMDSLGAELDAIRCLLPLLQQEQTHLISANIEELTALTEEKAKIVAHMAALAERRHHALAAAGYTADEAGMQAWLDASADAATSQTWAELLALAQSAKELNRTNGLLVNKHLSRNQNALNVLQGASQDSGCYGPDGQATTKAAARSLVIG